LLTNLPEVCYQKVFTMITVQAATGYTGRLICRELLKRGLEFQIAGRNAEKLRELAVSLNRPKLIIHTVDVTRVETCLPMLEKTSVLINCAGPFTDLGIGIALAAAGQGIHYIDTTGEQYFIKQIYDQCHTIAKRNGSALMPACAFEYAIADAGAEIAARGFGEVDEVAIYYAIGGFGASRGTKKSIIRSLTSPAYLYRGGKHIESTPSAEQRSIEFPKIGRRSVVSFGGGEVFSVPGHVPTRAVTTFMSVGGMAPWLLNIGVALLGIAIKTPLSKIIFNQIDNQNDGPNEQDRKRSAFTIICEAESGRKKQRVIITGNDPYGLTAIICAETAALLLDAGKTLDGATSPARAFGPETVQRVTEAAGVEWKAT
jgi:short subunit dehydrogenase-like uncharacterized protein